MGVELFSSPSRPASVITLIARRRYEEALTMLQEQLEASPGDTSLRIQLANVLVMQGNIDEAIRVLEGVADDFARRGFAAKAIAVLKKIQKLDPRRRDIEGQVVELFKSTHPPRQEAASAELPPTAGAPAAAVLRPVFDEASNAAAASDTAPLARVRSPLFDDFSEDELLQFVRGLELLTYEGGDIVLTEGEKGGDNLYVLTSGTAKTFVRNKEGGSTQVRQLNEGDFFGEISILTGKPRTATVTAATACELLRLDRQTLDSIIATHPRVREVLQQFYDERANNAAEAEIRGLDAGTSETVRLAGLSGDHVATETIVITDEDLAEDPTEFRLQNMRRVAIEHSRRHNWTNAVQAWQQYLTLKPLDADAANALGVLFGKLGRWMEAAQTFERLVEISSRDATVFFNLGLSYAQLDLLPQAAGAYRHAIAIDPNYEKARQNLASVLGRMKKTRGEGPG